MLIEESSEAAAYDREDMIEDSTDVSPSNGGRGNPFDSRPEFTFMGAEEGNALIEQISKFTSVEQYRDFLEKELGEEKLMLAYPLLKEFVSISFFNEHIGRQDSFLRENHRIGEYPLGRALDTGDQEVPAAFRDMDLHGAAGRGSGRPGKQDWHG